MCADYRVHVGITNRMDCQPSMPAYGVYVQRQKSLMLAPAAEKTLMTLVRSYTRDTRGFPDPYSLAARKEL